MDRKELNNRIHDAIEAGNLGEVAALIGNDSELRDISTVFGTWLHIAADEGQLPVVKWLLKAGADINRRSGIRSRSALNAAASRGHLEVARYLLSQGAEMDVSEPERNPLLSAILAGSLDMVKLLLEHGIDATVIYPGEYMPNMDANAYSFAWEQGQRQIADYIQKWTSEH